MLLFFGNIIILIIIFILMSRIFLRQKVGIYPCIGLLMIREEIIPLVSDMHNHFLNSVMNIFVVLSYSFLALLIMGLIISNQISYFYH